MDNHHKRKRQNSSDDEVGGDGNQTSRARTSTTDGETYDVFLSFSGIDTRKDFTDHLYKGLMNVGVRVFRDNEALHVGEEIGPGLDRAIKASKISIPIISPNYASSEWCLRELVHILECRETAGQVVLPVFCRFDVKSVRHQLGTFETAFHSHNGKYGSHSEVVQKWRSALREVADLKGWESTKIAEGREGELVEIVVTKVLNELRKATLDVTKYLVGIEDHKESILKMVEGKESSDAQAIVIHGMGGIGKTTLAKVIYNQLSTKFRYCTFLPNIREKLEEQKGRLEDLQKKLISGILGRQWSQEIQHEDEGINIIRDTLKQKEVLILFDDVHDSNQLKALARERSWFKSGSILIITTRNKDVLNTWEEGRLTYELNALDRSLSFRLFCRHAFRRDKCPSAEFNAIAKGIVSTTGGLPLAIEVIGSMLLGKSKDYWEDVFKKLRDNPHEDVQKKLRITYDVLTAEQKQIFLDIACLSIQERIDFAIYMWGSCKLYPKLGIEKLISLSLIKRGQENQLTIHDQLRDLGRAIVREEDDCEPGNRSRLWGKEAREVMESNQGTANVQALNLSLDLKTPQEDRNFTSEQFKGILAKKKKQFKGMRKLRCLWLKNANLVGDLKTPQEDRNFTSERFKDMKKLRYLRLQNANLVGDFENVLSDLRWLQWEGCDSLPTNFRPTKLVVLDLSESPITEEWEGWAQIEVVKNLKVLRLDRCNNLTSTPDFSSFEKLEILILRGCIGLRRIHPSISNLNNTLLTLDVFGCKSLQHLPDSIGSLINLVSLSLRVCSSLTMLPKSIGNLKSLTKLNIKGSKVMELPNSIEDLHNLKELDISETSITRIPANIAKLTTLQHFIVDCRVLIKVFGVRYILDRQDQFLSYSYVLGSGLEMSSLVGRIHLDLQELECNSVLVWNLDVHPHIRYIFWAIILRRLPVMLNLHERFLTISTRCCFCGEVETEEHMLLLCPWVSCVWFGAVDCVVEKEKVTAFWSWANKRLEKMDRTRKEEELERFCMLCWSIWMERCRCVYEGTEPDPVRCVDNFRRAWNRWLWAKEGRQKFRS